MNKTIVTQLKDMAVTKFGVVYGGQGAQFDAFIEFIAENALKLAAPAKEKKVKKEKKKFNLPEKSILSYIRDRKGRRKGMLIAVYREQYKNYSFGWSLCCPKDKFDKVEGLKLALQRTLGGIDMAFDAIPVEVSKAVTPFYCRAAKYFKDKEPTSGFKSLVDKLN